VPVLSPKFWNRAEKRPFMENEERKWKR